MSACRICSNAEQNRSFLVREMQLGLREEFEYVECARCGCLQIKAIPDDLSRYYSKEYYSLSTSGPTVEYSRGGIAGLKQRFIVRRLTRHFFRGRTRLGTWLARRSSLAGDYPAWVRGKRLELGLRFDSAILDVGCGTGRFLLDLAAQGLENLTGIDPFLDADCRYENGVTILKKALSDLNEEFDLIMLHHSFEHMPDPAAALGDVYRLLRRERYAVVRIPVTGSLAWERFGVHWFALDAPRHLHLHTPASMRIVAEQAGFEVTEVLFDASGISWWASEQYLRDIPLMDPRSYYVTRSEAIFTRDQMASFVAHDQALNAMGRADCACFFLRKRSP